MQLPFTKSLEATMVSIAGSSRQVH